MISAAPAGRSTDSGAQTFALSRWLFARSHVTRVNSFVDLDPTLDLPAYQRMAGLPRDQRPPQLIVALEQLVGQHVALLVVDTALRPGSDEARALVKEIRDAHPPFDGKLLERPRRRLRSSTVRKWIVGH